MADDPYAAFGDPVSDAPPAAAAPAAGADPYAAYGDPVSGSPTPVSDDEFRNTLHQMLLKGAPIGQIHSYVTGAGRPIDPSLDPAAEWAGKHPELAGQVIIDTGKPAADNPTPASDPAAPPGPVAVDNGDGAVGAAARGFPDMLTLGLYPRLGAVADSLGGTDGRPNIWNGHSFGDAYDANLADNRAILAGDEKLHPTARLGGQIAGALIPISEVAAGAKTALGVAKSAALTGGLTSAAYGFNSADADLATPGGWGSAVISGVKQGAAGAALGGIGGYAVGKVAPALGKILTRDPSPESLAASNLAATAAKHDVTMTTADLRPDWRNLNAKYEASPGSSGPTQAAMKAGTDSLEGAVKRLGGDGSPVDRTDVMGDTIQQAAQRHIDQTRDFKNGLYTQATRLGGDLMVKPQSAVDALDDHIVQLSDTPNANSGVLNLLKGMRSDLVDENGVTKPLSISTLRNMRTAMRGKISENNLMASDADRRVGDVMNAASGDISGALEKTSPEAAAAYRQADAYDRQRRDFIQTNIQPLIGTKGSPVSPEVTWSRVQRAMGPGGNNAGVGAVMQTLTPEERADFTATVAQRLGRASPDAPFSPNRFVTDLDKKVSPASREAILGPEGAQTLGDLRSLAEAKAGTANSLNRSRSGQVQAYSSSPMGAVLPVLGSIIGGPAGAAGASVIPALGRIRGNIGARVFNSDAVKGYLSRGSSAPDTLANVIRRGGFMASTRPALGNAAMHAFSYPPVPTYASDKGVGRDQR